MIYRRRFVNHAVWLPMGTCHTNLSSEPHGYRLGSDALYLRSIHGLSRWFIVQSLVLLMIALNCWLALWWWALWWLAFYWLAPLMASLSVVSSYKRFTGERFTYRVSMLLESNELRSNRNRSCCLFRLFIGIRWQWSECTCQSLSTRVSTTRISNQIH